MTERSKPKSVITRFNKVELIKYHGLVKKSRLSQQEYNLKCLLDKDIYVIDGILDLVFQIRKIGVNINQAVHLANENHEIDKHKIDNLDTQIKEIWNMLNSFLISVKK
ncbi:plasmid mobilization relaxosome protein MobC [Clostridium akagii]|uniref:plasmid mobilization relaxosome protein MobC n=1 Tax=Clostridium akagii TaxID=91623 RepID=UPI00047899A3|nr:plasmid mobilization relaxosome protein MobC [Clostridium akagii]